MEPSQEKDTYEIKNDWKLASIVQFSIECLI
jgi:hypothetical protein